MANAFEDYVDTLPMVAEWKMNEASGTLADTGSGTVGALTVQGTPLYQQQGDAFEDPITGGENAYQIDFDGVTNGDIAHTNNIADLEALTEGAMVVAYSLDSGYTSCEPIMIKPEVGTSKFCQIFIDPTSNVLRFQINDGTNVRRLDYGNATGTSRYNPGHDSPDVTHILVVQYDATSGEYQVWLDGHRLSEQVGVANEDNNTTTGTPGWISTLGSGNVLGIGGRPEYNGSGSFVSSSVNLNGQIEYVGFSSRPLTFSEIHEMFKRFMGGIERAVSNGTTVARYPRRNVREDVSIGPPAGLDTVTYLTGYALTSAASTFPTAVAAKRCNQVFVPSAHWTTNRSNTRGHSHPIATTSGESDVDQALNAYTISREGFSVAAIDGTSSSTTQPQSQLGKGGFWRTGATSASPPRGWYTINGETWDRYNFPVTGIGREENQVLPTTNASQPHAIFQWDYLAGTEGVWVNTTFTVMSTRPINQSVGRNETIKWSEDGRFLAIATQSTSGQTVATGGGGIHIYSIDRNAANIYGIAYTRETISGYTPSNDEVAMIQFFNDGTDDYAIVVMHNITTAGGMSNAVANLAVFKRSGTTWTATANLFNNGVTPAIIGTGNVDHIRSAWAFGDDLYVTFWRTGGTALTTHNVFEHYRWNGTYYQFQEAIENPYQTVESTPIFDAVPVAMYVTDDLKGAVVAWGGGAPTTAVDTRNVMGYDRDPDTGILSRRANWPNYRGGTTLYDTDGWKYVSGGLVGMTNIDVTDYPDGRDGE